MNRFVIISFLCIAGVLQLNAQEQKSNPDEQVIVNKKYDENGNLIQYDSTYIHQWSSDSTLSFSFGDPNLMDHSSIDSMLEKFGISSNFGLSPFNDQDFFEQFGQMFQDSPFIDHFNFRNDSLFQQYRYSDPHAQLPDIFNSPGKIQWQKEIQQQLEQFNELMPNFQNEEQRKDWDELMKKQKKEQEEFLRKLNESK